jgi:DNA-binding protein HU-beta
MTDQRSDYDFLDAPRRRYADGSAVVRVGDRTIDLNAVPDAFPPKGDARELGRADVIGRVAADTGLSHRQARDAVDAFIWLIKDGLRSGQEVTFTGFGKFHVAKRPARTGRNPRTGETMVIAESRVPRFTAGKALKEASAGAPARRG